MILEVDPDHQALPDVPDPEQSQDCPLREAFRAELPSLRTGLYVVTAREPAAEADFARISQSLRYLLRKQGLYRDGIK